jgi:hypothetical protein
MRTRFRFQNNVNMDHMMRTKFRFQNKVNMDHNIQVWKLASTFQKPITKMSIGELGVQLKRKSDMYTFIYIRFKLRLNVHFA